MQDILNRDNDVFFNGDLSKSIEILDDLIFKYTDFYNKVKKESEEKEK